MNKLANVTAEISLISKAIKDNNIIDEIVDIIGPGDFYDNRLGSIYSAIARVGLKGEINPSLIVEDLRSNGELENIGGEKIIIWLMEQKNNKDNVKDLSYIIRDLSKKRDQARAAKKAVEVIESGLDPLAEIATLSELSISNNDDDGFIDLSPVVEAIFSGTHRRLEPTMLKRTDNEFLLYGDGRLNLIAAPPESMKSWIAKLTCIQEMQKGNAVIYLDAEESDGITCSERIVSIAGGLKIEKDVLRDWLEGPINEENGIRDKNKKLFYYKAINSGIDSKVRGQVMRVLRQRRASFIVLDGFAAAMSSHEPPLEEDRARDVNMFLSGVVWPMTSAPSKPGILVVDHVAKSNGSSNQTTFQQRGPRGSGAKLAAVSGVALQAKVIQAGSAWQPGVVELYVVKDRPGRCKIVHRNKQRMVGVLKSNPANEGGVEITRIEIISPELADAEAAEIQWHLIAAEKISFILEGLHDPISKGELKELMNSDRKKSSGSGWRGETIIKAIDFLVNNGWAKSEKDGRFDKIGLLHKYKAEYGAIHQSERAENPFE